MSLYKQEVQRFRDYLTKQLETPDTEDYPIEVLFELWREKNPISNEYEENVRAIQLAIDELDHDPGISTEECDRRMREMYPFFTAQISASLYNQRS